MSYNAITYPHVNGINTNKVPIYLSNLPNFI